MKQFLIGLLVCLCAAGASAQTVQQGREAMQRNDFETAKACFEQAVKNDEKDPEAKYWLSTLLLYQRFLDADRAVDLAEEAVDINPNNADYQYQYGAALGMKAQNSGVIKQAIYAPKIKNAFLKAVELNPSHIQARMGLAQYYIRAPGIMGGDKAKAFEQADAIIAIDEIAGRVFKARLHEIDKQPAEAEKELQLLTQRKPKDFRSWRALGYYYLRTDKGAEAVAPFRKYVDLKPDTAEGHSGLGRAYLASGDARAAIDEFQKGLKLDAEHLGCLYGLAEAHEKSGNKTEAKDWYQRGIRIDKNDRRRAEMEKKVNQL